MSDIYGNRWMQDLENFPHKWMLKSCLLYAMQTDDIDEVNRLLDYGVDVDSLIYSGQNTKPAVCICIETRHFEIAKFLVKRGCSLSLTTGTGMSPLHLAVMSGDNTIVKFLIENRAPVNATDIEGQTPLHLACTFGQDDTVTALLAGGSNVNVKDANGYTPLTLACMQRGVKMAKKFLELGAQVNYIDRHGNTPLCYAVSHGSSVSLVDMLLKSGAEVNMKNNHGDSPLMQCVRSSIDSEVTCEVLKILLDHGSNVNFINSCGQTALHMAVCSLEPRIPLALINRGCDVNKLDSLDKSPLFYACRAWRASSVLLLIGTDINWKQEVWLHNERLTYVCDPELVHLCIKESTRMRTLKEQCRSVIRKTLSPNIERSIKQLEYPEYLKRYATLHCY